MTNDVPPRAAPTTARSVRESAALARIGDPRYDCRMAARVGCGALFRVALGGCFLAALGCGGGQLGNGVTLGGADSGARDASGADVRDASRPNAHDGSPPPSDARDASPPPPDARDASRPEARDASPPDAATTPTICPDVSYADCTSAPGCETPLGTATDCAFCGDPACTIANTLLTCRSANGCTSAACAVGYANCDHGSPDCETVIATGASCLPMYLGSVGYVTIRYASAAAAIGPDGSIFFGGIFQGTVSFGTPAAPDVRVTTPGDDYGFITKFNADGSYAWTQAFPATGESTLITGLAATADGGVVAVGDYQGTIDLDPGAGVQSHQTMALAQFSEAFVVKLAGDGSFVWGGTLAQQSFDSASNTAGVAIDGTGAIYVAGWYSGDVDFDLGPGTRVHTSRVTGGGDTGEAADAAALVKLTPDGELSWVQTNDGGACVPMPGAIAVATDGEIWVLGGQTDYGVCLPPAEGNSGVVAFAAYGPDGTPRGYWGIGGVSSLMWPRSIAAGPNGSVYIGGGAWGFPDLDPGSGMVTRLAGTPIAGGFILEVASDGSYLWDRTIADGEVDAVAGAPDGGVIGLGQYGAPVGTQADVYVTKLDADGTAAWTFSSGEIAGTVVSSGNVFVVTGSNGNSMSDMEPGPGVDVIDGATLYLSRFQF